MSDSDNDNDNLAPKTREIDVTAEMEALREREPGKVELAAKIAEEIRKEVGFEHNIRFEDGEFVLVASRRINDTQALEGEVTRAATVEGIVDHIIANDGHRIGYPPVNENAPGAGRAETESAARTVPPDPEGMNAEYAELAAASLRHFQRHTGSDWEDAPSDFLGDLMHFCDRNGFDFEHELERARRHYEEETAASNVEPQPDLSQQAHDVPLDDAVRESVTVDEAAKVWAAGWTGEQLEQWAARHAKAMDIRDGEDATIVMPSAPERDFLSIGFIVDRIADSLGRTVEMMLGAVYSFFVAEPKMTAQQVHDTLQAAGNVEALHAREVAAAAAVEGEAYEFRAMMSKNQEEAQNVRMSMLLGTDATAEANLGRDEYDNEREKEKSRLSL